MMPIDLAIARVECWIESIDKERDRIAQLLATANAGAKSPSDVEWGFLNARLVYLDVQRQEALAKLGVLRSQATWPEVMFDKRPVPTMVKAVLRRGPALMNLRRKTGTTR